VLRSSTGTAAPSTIKATAAPTATPVIRFVATNPPVPTIARPTALPTLRVPKNQPLPTLPVVMKPAVRTPTTVYTLPTPTGTLTATLTVIPDGTSLSTPQNGNRQPSDRTKQGIPGMLSRLEESLKRIVGR
jgi:hypothetical protein